MLTAVERRALLAIARAAIAAAVNGGAPGDRTSLALPDASGVFVTIKKHGQLRGCLGTLALQRDLAEEVERCAIDSATSDPRFPPVAACELAELTLEIWVLAPLEEIPARPEAFTIGQHGLVVEQDGRRGLLLPQVANEWQWTPEEFLAHTCVKAGLPPDAWRTGARLSRFAAEVFGD
jgi:AmmeMemoRadiSam system protein A